MRGRASGQVLLRYASIRLFELQTSLRLAAERAHEGNPLEGPAVLGYEIM